MEHKVITHIDCPKEWESVDDYSSHRPLIWAIINNIPHSCFLEFGMGDGSTPLLQDWYKYVNCIGKEYYSFETNRDWAVKYMDDNYKPTPRDNSFIDKNHCVIIPEDYRIYGSMPDPIVFIDSAPGEKRKYLIEIWGYAKALIIHDTEPGAEYVYGMSEILSTFKYRLDYRPEGMPHTTSVSNIIDITQWINQN